uniref:ROSINA-6 n=1 Tax=Antirrhinum majus TaxID=4151 RepID=B9ZSM7_ANTMA|nr:ROSINA-6 [Antirrhinum majus]
MDARNPMTGRGGRATNIVASRGRGRGRNQTSSRAPTRPDSVTVAGLQGNIGGTMQPGPSVSYPGGIPVYRGGTSRHFTQPVASSSPRYSAAQVPVHQSFGVGHISRSSSQGSHSASMPANALHQHGEIEGGEDDMEVQGVYENDDEVYENDDGSRGRSKGLQPVANPTERPWISFLQSGGFRDSGTVHSTIAANLRTMCNKVYLTYGKWLDRDKEACWGRFKNTFQWEPEMEMRVRAQYNKVARLRFTGSVNCAKRWWQSCCKDPEYARNHKTWIPEDLLLGYINYWKSTEAEVKSLTASQNRDKGEKVNYLGGSIGIDGHREKLAIKLNVKPEDVPFHLLWRATHVKILDDGTEVWANPRVKQAYDAYIAYCQSKWEFEKDWPIWDLAKWLEITGPIKKNRLPGLPVCGDPEMLGIQVRKEPKYIHVESSSRKRDYESQIKHLQSDNQELKKDNEDLKTWLAAISQKVGMPIPERFQTSIPETCNVPTEPHFDSTHQTADLGTRQEHDDVYTPGPPENNVQQPQQPHGSQLHRNSQAGGIDEHVDFGAYAFLSQ